MPLSDDEIRKQIEEDFRDKLLLEKKLKKKLRVFNNKIADKLRVATLTRTVPRAAFFQDELQGILKSHYKAVSREFRGRTFSRLSDGDITLTERVKEKLDKEIDRFIVKRSVEQAKIILATTRKNIESARVATLGAKDLVERSIEASNILSGKLNSREARTASLETQAMAEASKNAEAGAFIDQNPSKQVLKEWVTSGDERVRPAHVDADSQLQHTKDFYIVKGENLLFPGDTSFGATPGNVINCRCASVFSTS